MNYTTQMNQVICMKGDGLVVVQQNVLLKDVKKSQGNISVKVVKDLNQENPGNPGNQESPENPGNPGNQDIKKYNIF